ncbi:MAG: DCC1-like thiol-disulfide oxidoreductase family protein [Solirubrobacteraceae bacterium]
MTGRWALLYDSDCGFCQTSLALILSADRRRRLRPVPLGTPEADALLHDLTPAQRVASWHLVSPDRQRWSAGAAAPPLLRLLPAGALPAAVLAAAPRSTQRAYRWVVAHRTGLGARLPLHVRQRASSVIARHR